jgi:FkbM family methyltransferase
MVWRVIRWTMVRLVRWYTWNSPVHRGKARLMIWALQFADLLPEKEIVTLRDGRRLSINMSRYKGMCETIYFMGEYEPSITKIVSSIVRPGDTCLDLGANLGWYTTLLSRLVGENGSVHAFEPVPFIFAALGKNVELSQVTRNTFLNNLAVGDRSGVVSLHVFAGLPVGHSSVSSQGRRDYELFTSQMTSLDTYVEDHIYGQINFIKCDVEGAELMVLRGCRNILQQPVPPIWIMEMAKETAASFGYLPNELLEFMCEYGDYEFFLIDEIRTRIKPIRAFAREDIGANVLCIPAKHYRDRLNLLSKLIEKF